MEKRPSDHAWVNFTYQAIGVVTDAQDPDGDIDQAPSIAAEDQSLEEIEDEPDLEGDGIPDQPVEKKLEYE